MRGCVRLVAVVWCLAGTSPTTHPQALAVPLGTACQRRVAACYASFYILLMADLVQCCCDDQGRSFLRRHLDLRRSRCAPLCCPHACQPIASTRDGFRCLLLHGRWAACDQVRQRSHDPTYCAVAQQMLMSSASLCCRCTVSGVRPIRFLAILFVALVACRRIVDASFSRGSQYSRVAVSVTQTGKSWREVRRFDERMTMR